MDADSIVLEEESPNEPPPKVMLFGRESKIEKSDIDPDTWAALDAEADEMEAEWDAEFARTGRGLRDPSPEDLADWAKYGGPIDPDEADAIDAAEARAQNEALTDYTKGEQNMIR